MTLFPLVATILFGASLVSVQYDGALKGALAEIAQKGGLNILVSGDLNEHVQINLSNMPAEEALEIVAQSSQLELRQSGKTWVIRRAGSGGPTPSASRDTPPAPSAILTPPPAPTVSAVPADSETANGRDSERSTDEDHAAEGVQTLVGAGQPVVVRAGSHVDSVVGYGAPIIIEDRAEVSGDAVAFGGDVRIGKNAVVHGDAVSFGGQIIRDENATVHGDAVALGGQALGSIVAKGLAKSHRPSDSDDDRASDAERGTSDEREGHSVGGLALFLLQFSMLFGLGFLAIMFAPQRMKHLEASIKAEPGRNAAVGMIAFIASAPLTVILAVTLVGIPVVIFGWLAVGFLVPLGLTAVASTIGTIVPTGRFTKTHALVLAVGTFVLLVVLRIPVLGPIAVGCAALLAFGAIIRTRLGDPRGGTPTLDPLGATAP
jgi:hypothetical protein